MSIKIIKEPDIHITEGELSRFRYEYEQAMRYYAGPRPTLEEWIRRHKANEKPLMFGVDPIKITLPSDGET